MRDHETTLGRILREEGRKQSWLAQRVGISEARMSYIVHGLRPTDDEAAAIAEALGREVSEVFAPPAPTTGAAA